VTEERRIQELVQKGLKEVQILKVRWHYPTGVEGSIVGLRWRWCVVMTWKGVGDIEIEAYTTGVYEGDIQIL
jgi:hypothetical protein